MSVSPFVVRHARLLRIFRQLQSGVGLNATQLARDLGVCRRTVFRDLEAMRQSGVDIFYDTPLQCYRLGPCEELRPPPAFNHEELATLIAAVHLSVLHQAPDCRGVLRQSMGKLVTGLPSHMQYGAQRLIKSCSGPASNDNGVSAWSRLVHPLLMAIARRRVLRLRLFEPAEHKVIETRFAPYQMIASAGRWSVVGRSSHHRAIQTFDACQLRQAEITDQAYAVPRTF